MPKLKTNKGAAKRFRLTSKGRVKRKKAYKSHILTKKTHNHTHLSLGSLCRQCATNARKSLLTASALAYMPIV